MSVIDSALDSSGIVLCSGARSAVRLKMVNGCILSLKIECIVSIKIECISKDRDTEECVVFRR